MWVRWSSEFYKIGKGYFELQEIYMKKLVYGEQRKTFNLGDKMLCWAVLGYEKSQTSSNVVRQRSGHHPKRLLFTTN